MDPQQPYAPNQSQPPTIYGPALPPPSPTPAGQAPFRPPAPQKSNKKLFIIGGAVAGLVLLTIVALVVILTNGKKPPQQQQQEETTQAQGPQPAKAVDVEQANNSISQDISSLNDDQDFPADQLDDKSLKL